MLGLILGFTECLTLVFILSGYLAVRDARISRASYIDGVIKHIPDNAIPHK